MKKIISVTPQELKAKYKALINGCKNTCKETGENVELAIYTKEAPNTHSVIVKFRANNGKLEILYSPTTIAKFGLSELFNEPNTFESILAYACEESGLADACRRGDKLDRLVREAIKIALHEFSNLSNM